MRKAIGIMALLVFLGCAGLAGASPRPTRPIKVVLSPASTVPTADIMKNLVNKCPNVSVTLNPKESNYMLAAQGWSGNYRFTLYQKGGAAVFATRTQWLSNSVKDVCKFINSQN
ncbi:MAG TPA: hypothetical protein VMU43_14610 [Candidatus Acidoferrum sp.]|nr:hypothetical protein [Candidatus Acidoferrum sp.]